MRSFLLFGAGIVIAALGLHQQAKTRRVTPEPSRVSAESSGERTRQHYPPGKYPVMLMPDGTRRTIYSILNVRGPMRFGTHVWNEAGVPEGPLWVRVDLARQILSVFRGGHEIGSAVILYGTDGKPTPTGSFTVLQKDADYHSRTYDAPMPYMLRLTDDGVAIHGSDVRSAGQPMLHRRAAGFCAAALRADAQGGHGRDRPRRRSERLAAPPDTDLMSRESD